ncbi:MAG: preprotein translocase subunit SecG [Burkholderiales bacterium]|nr:preprotein translocase subunit SecG [Burkholderiales bacterium]
MNMLLTAIIVIQVLSALVIIGLVLLQHGKGADMGAAFGSGASGSLFGATGSSNFLSKSTAVAAVIFFCATLALAYLSNQRPTAGGGVMENLPTASAPAAAPKTATPPAGQAPAGNAAVPNASTPAPAPANQIPK